MTIRVVIADDHPLMLGAIIARLALEDDIDVVASATSCDGLRDAVALHRPDVVVADVIMADGSTIAILAELVALSPATRIVFLTGRAVGADVTAAMEGGAAGFLSKRIAPDDMPRHVRTAAAGDTVLDTASADAVIDALRQPGASPSLSPREHEILRLVADGMTNREIATRVALSLSTVKTNLERVFSKLEVSDRAAAVAKAKDRGLL